MSLKPKKFLPVIVVGAAALFLAACSQSAPVSKDAPAAAASSSTPTAQPVKKTGAPAPLAFNASGFFAGNAQPTFPAGEPGKVAVVAEGPLTKDSTGSAEMTFAYRNNTDKAIAHVDFTAMASAGGKLVGTGKSQSTQPAQVKPGEAGLGMIYFEDANSIPATGVTYAFTVTTMAADTSSYNTAPVQITQSSNNGTSIIGAATNKTGKMITGPYEVDTYCFNGGNLASYFSAFGDQDGDVAPNGTVSFTSDMYDTQCPTWATAVSGYFK